MLALLLSGCGASAQSVEQVRAARAFSDPQAQALAVAAATGDADAVRRLMRDDAVDPDVIFSRDNGMPLLAWPIHSQRPDGLQAMLDNGADPNVATAYPVAQGRTPANWANAMVWAAEQEDPVYLRLLLDHGGDPDTRNANHETLTYHAFIKGNRWQNVQLLVERGAALDVQAGRSTLLTSYAIRGGFMMVHWLLEQGADPTLDYWMDAPVQRADSRAIEAIFWHPGNQDDPTWQRRSQAWLIAQGYTRPAMPEQYRQMRERLGLPDADAEHALP